jgi:integrase
MRTTNRLTALQCARATRRGMIGDGNGLYLQVAEGGTKSWILRFKRGGRTRHFGIGPLHTVTLAEARQRAAEARLMLLDGKDPIEARKALQASRKAATVTFRRFAEDHIVAQASGWRGGASEEQWRQSLEAYVYPSLADMSVGDVGVSDVLGVLTPIWSTKAVTAGRVRLRIERVLDAAKARGLRSGDNPAAWKNHLDHLLPAPRRVRAVEHHAALPYAEIAGFMTALRKRDGVSARALEFCILTATRTAETLGAQWSEISLAEKLWTIDGSRTKGGATHRVPLADRALEILKEMAAIRQGDHVFPGRRGRSFAKNALKDVIASMDVAATTHGFRASFSTWCAEQTNFPSEVREMALGHAVGSAVERAYQRSDMFEKRRRLMSAWATYCGQPSAGRDAKVIALARQR